MTAARIWTAEETALWGRLRAHPFEEPAKALDFTGRLARTLGWPRDTTRALIEEYRRFCFLAAMSPIPMTPSEEVDEVWHLHVAYTRDYWDRWCDEALRCALHHDPTVGGAAEQAKYHAQYAETLALYEAYFGCPPAAFWPSAQVRFGTPRFRMVDRRLRFTLPKPSLRGLKLTVAFALAPTQATAFTNNPLDWNGHDFLSFYWMIIGAALAFALASRAVIRIAGRPADARNLSPVEIGYLSGGMRRAADTLFIELATQDAANSVTSRIKVTSPRAPERSELGAFRQALAGTWSHGQFIKALGRSAPAQEMIERLRRRHLVMGAVRSAIHDAVLWMPFAIILLLGVAKFVVGLARGKPVGLLTLTVLVAAIGFFAILRQSQPTTKEGREALADLKALHARVLRAPRQAELSMALALGGLAVLSGTAYASYRSTAASSGTASSGCGSSGSGCSGGGGGCGGCGS